MNDLISIIVPVYNDEKYIDRCINSLIEQKYHNLEIIIIDDGSTDSTSEMCDKWAEKDNRIVVKHIENYGVSNARKVGIEAATGNYIGFVDGDDWVDSRMYYELYQAIIKGNHDIASCKYSLVKSDADAKADNAIEETRVLDFCGIVQNLYNDCLWSLCLKLFKKELFDKADIKSYDISVSEDLLLNYSLFKHCNSLVVTNRKYYYYFRHSESVMAAKLNSKKINDSRLAYQIINDDFDKDSPAYPLQVANMLSNDFGFLMQIIRQDTCWECYNDIREEILKHRKYVFMSCNKGILNNGHKLGTILLRINPKLFNLLIKIKK